MQHTQAHTLSHPHLCIISVTSSHLFTANLHLLLNLLTSAVHRSDSHGAHLSKSSSNHPLNFFLPLLVLNSCSCFLIMSTPQLLRLSVLHVCNCAVTNPCLNGIRWCSCSLRPGLVTNCTSEKGLLKILIYIAMG